MTTQALRKQIAALVNAIEDDDVLQSILVLLEKTKAEEEKFVAGYDAKGNAITEDDLVKSLLESSAEVHQSGGTSLKDMRKTVGCIK